MLSHAICASCCRPRARRTTRRLTATAARRCHPDKNPDDKEGAEAKFKRVGEAMHTIEKGEDEDEFDFHEFDPMAMFMHIVQMQEMMERAGLGGMGVGFAMGGDVLSLIHI